MKPRFEASRRQREELAERFFGAVEDGDMDDLVELLSADVVVVGDNGGTKPAWPRPIVGRDRVAKLLAGMGRQSRDMDVTVRRAEINGQPGAEFLDSAGRLMYIITLDIADGAVQTVRSVINPASSATSARSPTCARCCTTAPSGVGDSSARPSPEQLEPLEHDLVVVGHVGAVRREELDVRPAPVGEAAVALSLGPGELLVDVAEPADLDVR